MSCACAWLGVHVSGGGQMGGPQLLCFHTKAVESRVSSYKLFVAELGGLWLCLHTMVMGTLLLAAGG